MTRILVLALLALALVGSTRAYADLTPPTPTPTPSADPVLTLSAPCSVQVGLATCTVTVTNRGYSVAAGVRVLVWPTQAVDWALTSAPPGCSWLRDALGRQVLDCPGQFITARHFDGFAVVDGEWSATLIGLVPSGCGWNVANTGRMEWIGLSENVSTPLTGPACPTPTPTATRTATPVPAPARAPIQRTPGPPFWVNCDWYGSAGGGFYWDPSSGLVWTAERGWHAYAPPGVG